MTKRLFLTIAGAMLAMAGFAQAEQEGEAQQTTTLRSYKLTCISFSGDKVNVTFNDGTDAKSYDMAELSIKVAKKGDANRDGSVTISDAVGVVNYILGNPSSDFNFYAADVNESDDVTISDAVGVVNIILNNE